MAATITSDDIRGQVMQATDASEGAYDVDGIVATIASEYGLVDIESLEHNDFWTIVIAHAQDPEA